MNEEEKEVRLYVNPADITNIPFSRQHIVRVNDTGTTMSHIISQDEWMLAQARGKQLVPIWSIPCEDDQIPDPLIQDDAFTQLRISYKVSKYGRHADWHGPNPKMIGCICDTSKISVPVSTSYDPTQVFDAMTGTLILFNERPDLSGFHLYRDINTVYGLWMTQMSSINELKEE